jgi:hypothetical protein
MIRINEEEAAGILKPPNEKKAKRRPKLMRCALSDRHELLDVVILARSAG